MLIDDHGTRVLVAEDNVDVDVSTVAVQSPADLGYTPILAADGIAAFTELAKNPHRSNVVFSNVIMTRMDGVELGQEILCLYLDLSVVMTRDDSYLLVPEVPNDFDLLHIFCSTEHFSQTAQRTTSWQRQRLFIYD